MFVREDYKEIINRILKGYEIVQGTGSSKPHLGKVNRKGELTTPKDKKGKFDWEGKEELGKTVRRKNKRYI